MFYKKTLLYMFSKKHTCTCIKKATLGRTTSSPSAQSSEILDVNEKSHFQGVVYYANEISIIEVC